MRQLYIKISFYTFLISLLTFTGCETVVNIDPPPYEPKLVVFSFNPVVNGKAKILVYVSQTVGIFDKVKNVENSTVTLEWNNTKKLAQYYKFEDLTRQSDSICFDNNGVFECLSNSIRFVNDVSDLYIFPLMDIPENTPITLTVSAPGFKTVTSTQTLLPLVPIDSITLLEEQVLDRFGDRVSALDLTFKDTKGLENYYMVGLYDIDENIFDTTFNKTYLGSFEVGTFFFEGSILVNDEGFDGDLRKLRLTYYEYDDNDKIFQWSSIDKNLFEYAKLLNKYFEAEDNPFSTPVSLPTNINNGHGIFALYSTHSKKIKK